MNKKQKKIVLFVRMSNCTSSARGDSPKYEKNSCANVIMQFIAQLVRPTKRSVTKRIPSLEQTETSKTIAKR